MKGFTPLVLGILATLAFSWLGLAYIPDLQIGHLDPQSDEEGTDIYPMPKSGMAERGRRVYVANGCFYCHSEQVRADYAASDIDRPRDAAPSPTPKWGDRRSAPRDYIFDRPALLGKMRMGPDLANIGKAAPAEEEAAPAQPSPANPAAPGASPPASNASPPPANAGAQQNVKPAAQPAPSDSSCCFAARRKCVGFARERCSATRRQTWRATTCSASVCCLATTNCRSPFARCVTFRLPGGLLRGLASSTSLRARAV